MNCSREKNYVGLFTGQKKKMHQCFLLYKLVTLFLNDFKLVFSIECLFSRFPTEKQVLISS